MLDSGKTPKEKKAAMQKAINAHKDYTVQVRGITLMFIFTGSFKVITYMYLSAASIQFQFSIHFNIIL